VRDIFQARNLELLYLRYGRPTCSAAGVSGILVLMLSAVAKEPIPLATDANGVIRVAETRVPLETIVDVFNTGATPEEIAQDFPVLCLADVYAVITYYLRHREEVEAYLGGRRAAAEKIRREIEARSSQHGLRERLLARLGR
jgi:uncharacterized protein (DUF433 family)